MRMNYEKLPKTISAEELLSTPLPPVKWIIPGLLPAGLALFAGPSKAGKSWLTLWLCLQIAQGNPVWNREIEPRTVIYFSLEDTFNRLQSRIFQLIDGGDAPERLILQTECPSIGQGLEEMDKIAAQTLDETFRTALSGDSKDYRESSSSLMFAFILALILIYLILAAQFESFKDPFIIMLTVPLAIAGALIFMYAGGITMNIFSQIGIIMLIGLVAKNGILIVEFANQKQESGENKMQAIRDAALQRLRPILMTSASTVLGLIPLAFATGEGANQRIAMGTAVVGGMLVSTFLTMYIVPAIYSYISTNRNVKTETV